MEDNPFNLISFPTDGDFHKTTENIIEWEVCGGHDNGRHVTPSIYIERLLRAAPVKGPAAFKPEHFMTKCLDGRAAVEAVLVTVLSAILRARSARTGFRLHTV